MIWILCLQPDSGETACGNEASNHPRFNEQRFVNEAENSVSGFGYEDKSFVSEAFINRNFNRKSFELHRKLNREIVEIFNSLSAWETWQA